MQIDFSLCGSPNNWSRGSTWQGTSTSIPVLFLHVLQPDYMVSIATVLLSRPGMYPTAAAKALMFYGPPCAAQANKLQGGNLSLAPGVFN